MGRSLVAVLVLTALSLTACRTRIVRRDEAIPTTPSVRAVGAGVKIEREGAATPSLPPAPAPTLVVRLKDDNGLNPKGIPVRIEGVGASRTALTDERGEVKLFEPPGRYDVRVVQGCHDAVEVSGGGFGSVAVPGGPTKTVELPVRWRHRVTPAPPIFADPAHGWAVGDRIRIRYDVVDRCAKDRAPGGEYPTFSFRTSPSLAIVGTPVLEADGDGRAWFSVSCETAGSVRIIAQDMENPADVLDLVRESLDIPARCTD